MAIRISRNDRGKLQLDHAEDAVQYYDQKSMLAAAIFDDEYTEQKMRAAYQKRVQDLNERYDADNIPGHIYVALRKSIDEDYFRMRAQRAQRANPFKDTRSYQQITEQAMLDASHDAEDGQDDDQQQGEMIMNLLNTKIVGVKFTNGNSDAPGYDKQYHYLTDDLSIKVDDYCIVVAPSGAPAVVKVYEANAVSSRFDPLKMILCKIDMDTYREKQRIIVQRAAAIKRLEQIEKEQTAQERFKKLALVSDEAAELLKVLGVISPPTSIEGVAANQAIEGTATDEPNNAADDNA